jgi:DNA replication regulator DPB11
MMVKYSHSLLDWILIRATVEERMRLANGVVQYGGEYHGDLTKEVTHLIVATMAGKKYQYACQWGIKTVSVEWFEESILRGLSLDESLYDPRIPKEKRGLGAWVRVPVSGEISGKRKRDSQGQAEFMRRKLRRTASAKLSSQNEAIWDDITSESFRRRGSDIIKTEHDKFGDSRPQTLALSAADSASRHCAANTEAAAKLDDTNLQEPEGRPRGIFQGRVVFLHAFDDKKVQYYTFHSIQPAINDDFRPES